MSNDCLKTLHVGQAWRLVMRDLGLDEAAILRRARQPLTLLEGEGSRISLDEYYALFEAIDQECDDPTIALRAGHLMSIELFDPALFAAICSPDINVAATRLGQFKRQVGPFSLDLDVDRDETRIVYRAKSRLDLPLICGLSEVVFLVAFARRATRHTVVPRRVTARDLPKDLAPYEAFFGCPLETGDAFSVVFFAKDAARPFLTHNERMWEAFEPGLRRRMAEAGVQRSIREQVETALFELLPSGRSQLRDVAKEMRMGSRTLQRHLATEETSWLKVLNGTRERLACHYLRSSEMSPTEISFLLGFEDPNSLYRAFQRWRGMTPESWRAKNGVASVRKSADVVLATQLEVVNDASIQSAITNV